MSCHMGTTSAGALFRRCHCAFLLAPLFLFGLIPMPHGDGTSLAEWSNLNRLHPEEKIEIIDMNLKKFKGTFQEFSEDSLTLKTNQGPFSLQRSDVYRVTSLENPKRARNALIGLGVGLGALGIIAAAAGDSIESPGGMAGCWSALVGGAAIGAAIPSYRTIYRAAQGPKSPSK